MVAINSWVQITDNNIYRMHLVVLYIVTSYFSPIGGFEFALDGMLNIHASGVKYWKPTVSLWKCNLPRPFAGKTAGERSVA